MAFLNNMKVGSKIYLLIVILMIAILAVAISGINSLRMLNNEIDILYNRNVIGLSAAKEANAYLIKASRGLRNMAITRYSMDDSVTKSYLDSYNTFIKGLYQELDTVKNLVVLPEAKKLVDDCIAVAHTCEKEWQNMIDNIIMPNKPQAEMVEGLRGVRPNADKLDDLLTELSNEMERQAAERNKETDDQYWASLYMSIAIVVVAMVLGCIFGFMVMRAIASPLVSVAGKAERVAEGDLDQDFTMVRNDEIGSLADALAKMVSNLKLRIAEAEQKSIEAAQQSQKAQEAMGEAKVAQDLAEQGRMKLVAAAENVDQVVSRLSAATEQLSAQIEQSSRSAEVQRDRVTSSATAMEEMNATVLEVARNAGVASEGSDAARKKAVAGADIVRHSIEALGLVQNSATVMSNEVMQLGQQAEAIGTIMTVISDIADQTNLLALNAAIEAARAGEYGRGFAVVADEVRKLAEKTMEATKEVGSAITGIQQGTQRSISAMTEAASSVEKATGLAMDSGKALEDIVSESDRTADQVRNIAAAAEEQSAASDEITQSLDEINRLAAETASVMQQSAQAIMELSQQTTELKNYMSNLRG